MASNCTASSESVTAPARGTAASGYAVDLSRRTALSRMSVFGLARSFAACSNGTCARTTPEQHAKAITRRTLIIFLISDVGPVFRPAAEAGSKDPAYTWYAKPA